MKEVGSREFQILQEFVREVLTVCRYDFDGVTYGLEDKAFQAGEILGLTKEELDTLLWGKSEV